MTIYNQNKIVNLLQVEQIKAWYKRGLLSAEQQNAVVNAKSGRYSRSHFLYRVGVFLLTTVILACSIGTFGLFTNMFDKMDNYKFFLLLIGLIHFVILYHFIKQKQHFKSGVDDALLYWGLGYCITFIQLTFNNFEGDFMLVFLITTIPVVAFAGLYFIDRTLSVLTYFGLLTLLFVLALKAGIWGKVFLPFIIMFFSLIIFFIVKKFKSREKLYLWHESLDFISICCLITFYLSGNYFVVRQASEMLMNISVVPGQDIPYAFIFYVFTIAVPLVYISLGLKNKNYSFLNLGLLFFAVAVLTIRYYYSILPPELALVAGGLVLLGICAFVFSYLKIPKYGITIEKDNYSPPLLSAVAEAIIIAETFVPVAEVKPPEGTPFGGGDFGGGGAGSGY